MSVRVVCVIQARLNSTRLPEKIMKPILGKPMVLQQLERITRSYFVGNKVMLDCPDRDMDMIRGMLAVYRCEMQPTIRRPYGDENDLIMRHLDSAMQTNADLVVRIPGDNPLAWAPDIDKMISQAIYTDLHLRHDKIISNIYERDTGCEVWPVKALHYANSEIIDPELREHPHRIWKREEEWQKERKIPYHFDVNTEEDYLFVKDIFEHFGHNRFSPEEAIEYLEKRRNPS